MTMKWRDVMLKEPAKDLRIVASYPYKDYILIFTGSAVFKAKDGVLEEVSFESRL